VSEEKGRLYVVKKGDWLSKIARRFKLPGWETIWDHEKNAQYKKNNRDPNLIYPGDEFWIPGVALDEVVTQSGPRRGQKDETEWVDVKAQAGTGLKPVAQTVYMDIGCWQGKENAESTCMSFGMIAGGHIVLACFNSSDDPWYIGVSHSSCFTDEQLHEEKADDYSAPIFEVLKGICKQSKTGANYYNHILQWVELKSTHSFTEKGELLVFIPDLHLHWLKESSFDNFSYGRKWSVFSKIISLDKAFCQFLRILADVSKHHNVKVFQLGDLYELWESWCCKQRRLNPDLLKQQDIEKWVFRPLAKLIDKDNDNIYKAVVSNLPESEDIKNLKREIGDMYSDVFSALRELDTVLIRGNHDNWLNAQLTREIIHGESVVYAEHGHRWDDYNSPNNWKEGYYWTCRNVWAEERGLGTQAKRFAGSADRPSYKNALKTIRTSDRYRDKNFVYVMAHTHEPYLEEL
jgi:UDP-2,3-diacylglucosamine pyrophosphatase LpxH